MSIAVLPAFTDNYIFALHGGGGVVVVDPGDAAVVQRHLAASAAELVAILITHHHPDHVGGLAALRQQWPLARCFGPNDPRIAGLTDVVADGAQIDLADNGMFRVLATPGHTRSHIVYLRQDELFCGDVVFSLGCGRVFEGDAAQMLNSLDRIAELAAQTRIYCAHEYSLSNARFALHVDGENRQLQERVQAIERLREQQRPSIPTTVDSERRCNPFLRCSEPAIRAAVSAHCGTELTDRVEVFAALRAWKNQF